MAEPAHTTEHSTPRSIALQVAEDIDGMRVAYGAYACIEKLISPQRLGDSEEVYPTRSELAALVGTLNDDLARRIEAAETHIDALRSALAAAAAANLPAAADPTHAARKEEEEEGVA